jgi:hypothetical protein
MKGWPHIKKAQRKGKTIVFLDESSFILQPMVRWTWAPKGQTPIRYNWDRRDRLSVISVIKISPKRRYLGLYFAIQDSNICTDDFVTFVTQFLMHFPRGIILVVDRWMVHRSGVRQLREHFGRRVDVEWLPPYAPELNPVQQIWNHNKYGQLVNFIVDDINNLADEVDSSLRYQAGQQNLLRLFFHYTKLKI